MASDEWLKKRYKMEAMVQHMSSNIAADPLPADPHAPVKVPKDQPGSSPWLPGKSPAPSRKGLASTQIKPNNIMVPFVPKDAETDEEYGEGNVPGHPDWSGVNQGTDVAGNPSFDINETPATRRTRKIRTLQERGVGGEAGNAGDILKKGLQLPNIQANVDYGTPSELDKWLQLYQRNGGSLRHLDPDLRKLILQRGSMKAQGGKGHTTVGDKLYLDPIKQKLMPLPIDTESDKDKEIRHNQRFKV